MRMLTPYWTSRTLASDLFDEMDGFLKDFNGGAAVASIYDERGFSPACEIAEGDDHYLMSVDLPGMKKEEIKIEVADHVLTVSGERKREMDFDKSQKVQRYEKAYGYFKRSFTLPATVETGKVEARYEEGVLTLWLPKVQEAKPRQIEIHSGKGGIFEKLLGGKKDSAEVKE